MFCIVGLGNPGREYAETKHNVGFWVLDALAEIHGISADRRRFRALFGKGFIGKHEVVLVKPQTFMNSSGQSASLIARFYKIDPADMLVIYDDMAIPPGTMRIRRKGSAAGHRGIQDVMDCLGTDKISRLRIGIGQCTSGQDARQYVLSPFRPADRKLVDDVVIDAAQCVKYLLDEGIDAAMNKFN